MEILNSVPRGRIITFTFEQGGNIDGLGGNVWKMGNGFASDRVGIVLPFRGRFVGCGLMRNVGSDNVTIELLERVNNVNTPVFITPEIIPPSVFAKFKSGTFPEGGVVIPRTATGTGTGGRLFLYYEEV